MNQSKSQKQMQAEKYALLHKMVSQIESEKNQNQRMKSEATELRGQMNEHKRKSELLEKDVKLLAQDLAKTGGD